MGLSPLSDGFQQEFTASDGSETANVIATVPGTDATLAAEVIVVGAHHDHLGEDESGIFPGANDDASGVAVVLGLAGYFAEHPARRTLVFAAFGAEELDLDGSKYFVENPEPGFALDDTVFMLNLDMVGAYRQLGIVNAINTYPRTPSPRRARRTPALGVDGLALHRLGAGAWRPSGLERQGRGHITAVSVRV